MGRSTGLTALSRCAITTLSRREPKLIAEGRVSARQSSTRTAAGSCWAISRRMIVSAVCWLKKSAFPLLRSITACPPRLSSPRLFKKVAAVAKYVHDNGAQLGIDGARLGFAGDSGGAHLGLAATMYLRGEMGGSEFVKCLLLFYGWYGLADSASQRLLGGPWDGLTESEWLWYKDLYAEDVNELQTSPYANLLLNDMTHDMPACYIAAAEFDPLRDDSSALAAICEEHGIPHRYEMFEGVIHAFLHYTRMLDEANDALEHAATFFRQQLGL